MDKEKEMINQISINIIYKQTQKFIKLWVIN